MKELLDPDVLPYLIELRLVSLAEIRAAADVAIGEEAEPSHLLIELSLGKDLNEVLSVVGPHGADPPTDRATAILIRRFRAALECGAVELGEGLRRYHRFASSYYDPASDVWFSAVEAEDAYELAAQGVFGSVEDVRREILGDLAALEVQLRRVAGA